MVASLMPSNNDSTAQERMLEAVKSNDPATQEKGKNALLLLNAKTIVSNVNYWVRAFSLNAEEADDLTHELIASILTNVIPRATSLEQFRNSLYFNGVLNALHKFLADRDNIPQDITKNSRYLFIHQALRDIAVDEAVVTDDDLVSIAEELEQQTGISSKRLLPLLSFARARRYQHTQEELVIDGDSTWESVNKTARREDVQMVIESLQNPRQERAISLRYGLDDGKERTLEQIGKELGVTGTRAGQIIERAEVRLRHPFRASTLDEYWIGQPITWEL